MLRIVRVALIVVVVAAGCSDDSGPEVSPSSSAIAAEPALVDRGVIRVPPATVSGVATGITVADPSRHPNERRGELLLNRCHHLAPGRWALGGEVLARPDDGLVRQTLWFETGSDVVNGFAFDLATAGIGEFTATVDLPDSTGLAFEGHDENDECVIGDQSNAGEGSAVTVASEPLVYEAPAGSLQALGIGARLDQAGSLRTAWARHAWLQTALPFAEIWIPTGDHQGSGFRGPEEEDRSAVAHHRGNCLRTTYVVGENVRVEHEAGCSPSLEPGEPLTSNPDFFWVEGDDSAGIDPRAVMQRDHVRVSVGGPRAEVEALVGELAPVTNLVIDHDAVDGTFSTAELAAAKITDGPRELAGLVEHGRIDHDLGTISVWTATDPNAREGSNPHLMVALLVFEAEGRINAQRIGGGWDGCHGLVESWSEGTGASVLLMLADPSWTAEIHVPEPYGPPTMIDGIWFAVFPDAETTIGVNLIGIHDAEGHPVDCFERPPG